MLSNFWDIDIFWQPIIEIQENEWAISNLFSNEMKFSVKCIYLIICDSAIYWMIQKNVWEDIFKKKTFSFIMYKFFFVSFQNATCISLDLTVYAEHLVPTSYWSLLIICSLVEIPELSTPSGVAQKPFWVDNVRRDNNFVTVTQHTVLRCEAVVCWQYEWMNMNTAVLNKNKKL